ncbi:unnamed protein product [Protopolystoma xenopodis]|uniref:Uncharacterized protein n=1 Tax=Protopolystoma xenopodis TaxID=117903 RepID=A0A448XQA6_9PLAT|nr:unnamed protein product [Protopolystoma xenopodis]
MSAKNLHRNGNIVEPGTTELLSSAENQTFGSSLPTGQIVWSLQNEPHIWADHQTSNCHHLSTCCSHVKGPNWTPNRSNPRRKDSFFDPIRQADLKRHADLLFNSIHDTSIPRSWPTVSSCCEDTVTSLQENCNRHCQITNKRSNMDSATLLFAKCTPTSRTVSVGAGLPRGVSNKVELISLTDYSRICTRK